MQKTYLTDFVVSRHNVEENDKLNPLKWCGVPDWWFRSIYEANARKTGLFGT